MPGPADIVRPFQLPSNTPEQLYLSQYNLAANTPIYVTPGGGASNAGAQSDQIPQVEMGGSHFSQTITFYMDQASTEVREV